MIEGEKTRAGKIGFFTEDAIEFDGMANGFVNLQSKLTTAKNQSPSLLRALRCGMQSCRLFGNDWRVKGLSSILEAMAALPDLGLQLIVAGGETSGAVVTKLGVDLLRIGREIDPGVPWTLASGGRREFALALKSGNFGSEEFFVNAWRHLGPSQ